MELKFLKLKIRPFGDILQKIKNNNIKISTLPKIPFLGVSDRFK